jgi:glycosyltransferase involved in cell wall biosynthesis
MSRVTVGLPVHNDPVGLRRSVPTVFGQTWEGEIRLLVIDDGSTDETPEVLEELADRYGRITVVRNDPNRGRPFARNTILEHAGDDYLAWIDADDLWHPRKLELQFQALESAEQRGVPVLCTCPVRFSYLGSGSRRQVPVTEGDQLRLAMTGELPPYLPTMLGRAQHFRDAGGFDERMLRRQDYEFFLRFLAAGGRVVSTRASLPLMTYIKSDVGRSPRQVAAANRVIEKEHGHLYRRYGRRFARARRAERMLLVARYYERNGELRRARLYRARARINDPLERLVRTRAVTLAVRSARRALRLARRVERRATSLRAPALRRGTPRATSAATAPAATPAGPVVSTPTTSGPIAEAERLFEAGEQTRIVDVLGPLVADGDPSLPPRAWYLLSEGHRHALEADRALDVLRRGMAEHPDDDGLRVRLAELRVLREEWTAATDAWEEVRDLVAHHTALTYALLARAHRVAGDHVGAHEVAAAGAERFPKDADVQAELGKARAHAVDWARAAAVASPPAVLREEVDVAGTVTDLGFLAGRDAALEGTVAPRFGRAPIVALRVNDKPIALTHAATPAPGEPGRFSFRCDAMLEYLGDGDLVTVDCERVPLSLEGGGTRVVVATGYPSRAAYLRELVSSGHVFTKFGRLRQGNISSRKQRLLELFEEVSEVVAEEIGVPCHPFYGNLLGAVRENDFIKHDVGGFDMGYVSRRSAADEVRAEFLGLCRALLDRGYELRLEPWGVMVREHPTDRYFVDVNFGWFTEDGELQLSYGWRYPPVTDRVAYESPRSCPVGGRLVPIPGNAEQVLEQVYGPNWPIPDQGFDVDAKLQRSFDHLLRIEEMEALLASHPDRVRIYDVLDETGQAVPYEAPQASA